MDNKLTMKMLTDKLPEIERVEVPLDGVLTGMTLNVRKTLTMNDAMKFISDVVSSCASVDEGVYTYAAYDFAMKANTISYYAELKIGKSDMGNLYRLIYETNIYDKVMDVINTEQHYELVNAVLEELSYAREMLTSTAGMKTMELLSQINEFAQMATQMTEQMRGIDIEGAMDAMMNISSAHAPESQEEHKVLLMKKPEKKDDGA